MFVVQLPDHATFAVRVGWPSCLTCAVFSSHARAALTQ